MPNNTQHPEREIYPMTEGPRNQTTDQHRYAEDAPIHSPHSIEARLYQGCG
jgi:hypothetical protein